MAVDMVLWRRPSHSRSFRLPPTPRARVSITRMEFAGAGFGLTARVEGASPRDIRLRSHRTRHTGTTSANTALATQLSIPAAHDPAPTSFHTASSPQAAGSSPKRRLPSPERMGSAVAAGSAVSVLRGHLLSASRGEHNHAPLLSGGFRTRRHGEQWASQAGHARASQSPILTPRSTSQPPIRSDLLGAVHDSPRRRCRAESDVRRRVLRDRPGVRVECGEEAARLNAGRDQPRALLCGEPPHIAGGCYYHPRTAGRFALAYGSTCTSSPSHSTRAAFGVVARPLPPVLGASTPARLYHLPRLNVEASTPLTILASSTATDWRERVVDVREARKEYQYRAVVREEAGRADEVRRVRGGERMRGEDVESEDGEERVAAEWEWEGGNGHVLVACNGRGWRPGWRIPDCERGVDSRIPAMQGFGDQVKGWTRTRSSSRCWRCAYAAGSRSTFCGTVSSTSISSSPHLTPRCHDFAVSFPPPPLPRTAPPTCPCPACPGTATEPSTTLTSFPPILVVLRCRTRLCGLYLYPRCLEDDSVPSSRDPLAGGRQRN
ncbi:hypothetical protein C8R45DRAFT_927703 [Mycena sanguinolenta]|nr:hypothetical protein C8R45DRAFT_927703 [Mycena sanguinolenta]